MNFRAIRAIYNFEMARTWRTLLQSIVSPVVSTSLYFVVFGAAIGSRISQVEGISYGTFIVPGLVMLSVLTQSITNASFGIYFPKFVGTIYEILSAPVSYVEIVLGYVGAAATKSIVLGLIILATAGLFVPLHIHHPVWMVLFLVMTAVTFSLFGFIIGIWADGFEKLQMIPMLVVMPLTFLGGSFYSVNMLPSGWRTVALLNPVVYLISGFRWSFYEIADVNVAVSFGMTAGVSRHLHDHRVVDLQDRLSPEEVTREDVTQVRVACRARQPEALGITDSSGKSRSGRDSRGSDASRDAERRRRPRPRRPLRRHPHQRRRPRRRRPGRQRGYPRKYLPAHRARCPANAQHEGSSAGPAHRRPPRKPSAAADRPVPLRFEPWLCSS